MIIISIIEHDQDGTVAREIVSRYRPEQFRWSVSDLLKKYVPEVETDQIRHIIEDMDTVREAKLNADVMSVRYLFTRHTVEVAYAKFPIQ